MTTELGYLSAEDVRRRVLTLIADAGGYSALARRLGTSPQYVYRAASGRANPSGKLLRALGLERRTMTVYLPSAAGPGDR